MAISPKPNWYLEKNPHSHFGIQQNHSEPTDLKVHPRCGPWHRSPPVVQSSSIPPRGAARASTTHCASWWSFRSNRFAPAIVGMPHQPGKKEWWHVVTQKLISVPILLGGIPTPLKNMTSSVGVIIPNIWKVIKFMFQNTNQYKFTGLGMLRVIVMGWCGFSQAQSKRDIGRGYGYYSTLLVMES